MGPFQVGGLQLKDHTYLDCKWTSLQLILLHFFVFKVQLLQQLGYTEIIRPIAVYRILIPTSLRKN